MDLVTGRKLISYAFRSKKGKSELSRQEFINEIAFKGKFLSEEDTARFIEEAVKAALISTDGNTITPMFSTSGIVIPLDFSVGAADLFAASRDSPIAERMLDSLIVTGKLARQEALSKLRNLQGNMRYINYEIALLSLLTDYCVDTSEFLKEMGA